MIYFFSAWTQKHIEEFAQTKLDSIDFHCMDSQSINSE